MLEIQQDLSDDSVHNEIIKSNKMLLLRMQELFQLNSSLVTPIIEHTSEKKVEQTRFDTEGFYLHSLENELDRMDSSLPKLKNFILLGTNILTIEVHMCRVYAREVERRCYAITAYKVEDSVKKYVNRLSDYFFVLARYLNHILYGGNELVYDIKYKQIFR